MRLPDGKEEAGGISSNRGYYCVHIPAGAKHANGNTNRCQVHTPTSGNRLVNPSVVLRG